MAERNDLSTYEETRRSLHGIAELVLAGAQYAAVGSIRLRVDHRGIAPSGPVPDLLLEAGGLVTGTGRLALSGTCSTLAAAAGLSARRLSDVYAGGSGVDPDDPIRVDPDAAAVLVAALAMGDDALADFAPDEERVLWPEHFDVALTQHEVNYGVSPGDEHLGEPYAYVGPWQPRVGPFWNAPFGAARAIVDLGSSAAVADFFREGSGHASTDPRA
jgi:hypothetical protein